MAVLIHSENRGQTAQGYDGMLAVLERELAQAPGFIAHGSHAIDGGWLVVELWESKADADAFFTRFVVPKLPPGIHPKRSVASLHSLVSIGRERSPRPATGSGT